MPLLLLGVQLVEHLLQLVELLSCFAQLALRGQALIVREVFSRLGDQSVRIR